jgi:hypothetical protein
MDIDDSAGLLRRVLHGNAIFSFVCGLVLLASRRGLGAAFGIAPAGLGVFGATLVGFAAHLWMVARKHAVPRREALYLLIVDASYVAASAIVLLGFPDVLRPAGRLFFSIAAGVVAIFCVLEYLGLRRLRPSVPARV